MVTVLGGIANAVGDGGLGVFHFYLIWPDRHLAVQNLLRAEQSLAHRVHPALGQAADAQDLALVQLQVEAHQVLPGGDAVGPQHHLVGIAVVVAAVVVALDLAADHHLFHQVGVELAFVQRADDLAVPQHGDGVALLDQLVQVVADEQDAVPLARKLMHQLVQQFTPGLGQGGGGLVHDEDLGLPVHPLGDLHQLALLHAQPARPHRSVDLDAEGIQQFLGFLHHPGVVDERPLGKHLLVPEEDVVRYRDVRDRTGFLYDHADAGALGFQGTGRVPGLALVKHLAAGGLLDARRNG